MDEAVEPKSKADFFNYTVEEFDRMMVDWGWPKFRAQQVRGWVYHKGILDPQGFTNLSQKDRDTLAERLTFGTATVTVHQISEDGTQKLLLQWPNGSQAETVMIPAGDRRTACVSSQVGCPVGCKFCASGMEGVKGNLTAGQIVEQVVMLNQAMAKTPPNPGKVEEDEADRWMPDGDGRYPDAKRSHSGRSPGLTVTNIVFMGMGEPMSNYANVMKAIRILHDTKCLNIGARRITVSTVGVPAKMREMAGEELPLNLAISLHAPNEPLRKQLIPWAEHFSMPDILDAARYYFDQTGREITFEYILLNGVNDQPEHARELAQICKTVRANVNLLRYNEVETLPFKRPNGDAVVRFQEILRKNGVNAHVRKSRGRDIAAACGQLRRRENEKQKLVTLGA